MLCSETDSTVVYNVFVILGFVVRLCQGAWFMCKVLLPCEPDGWEVCFTNVHVISSANYIVLESFLIYVEFSFQLLLKCLRDLTEVEAEQKMLEEVCLLFEILKFGGM